jgi:hypothetical protein
MVEKGRGVLGMLFLLLLSGCFLVPGEFVSNLDIRKDGTFTFAYKGQIAFVLPDDFGPGGSSAPKVWDEKMAKCFKNGTPYYDEYGSDDTAPAAAAVTMPAAEAAAEGAAQAAKDAAEEAGGAMDAAAAMAEPASESEPDDTKRPCKPAEIAKLKKEFDDSNAERVARKKKEAEQMAAIFGLGPNDDAGNRKIAAELTKYAGWKTVTYAGKGIYNVDYQLTGRTGHDFIFPVFPKGDIMIPFVTMRPRADGTVFVSATALSGGGFKGLSARMAMLGAAAGGAGRSDMPQTSVKTSGTFTITTDGVPLTNNTDDGPSKGTTGQTLTWIVDNNSEKIPEALIRLR